MRGTLPTSYFLLPTSYFLLPSLSRSRRQVIRFHHRDPRRAVLPPHDRRVIARPERGEDRGFPCVVRRERRLFDQLLLRRLPVVVAGDRRPAVVVQFQG